MRYFVTGCAGFVGSTLTERLLSDGHAVVGYDNLSTAGRVSCQRRESSETSAGCAPMLLDLKSLTASMGGSEFVFHLAANADVRFGAEHPRKDLEQNTIATHNVLESMRANGIGKIAFSSTGSVYGESPRIPTPEDAPFPIQTSLYGASKAAGEGMIAAYCAAFGFQSFIFRFVSLLGERYTHGHVVDFYRQLIRDPSRLRVLGDGRQRKSYLYVRDCIDAMLVAVNRAEESVNIFNLGIDGHCEVNDSIGWICEMLELTPRIEYAGGPRGWIGDNPFIHLDTKKIRRYGWNPTLTIKEGVQKTLQYLMTHPHIADARS